MVSEAGGAYRVETASVADTEAGLMTDSAPWGLCREYTLHCDRVTDQGSLLPAKRDGSDQLTCCKIRASKCINSASFLSLITQTGEGHTCHRLFQCFDRYILLYCSGFVTLTDDLDPRARNKQGWR